MPTSPMTFSSGTRQSSKTSSHGPSPPVITAWLLPTVNPGVPFSTMKHVTPSAAFLSGSVTAKSWTKSAFWPLDDEVLGAVDDPVVAVLDRPRLHRLVVAAGAGF